MTISRSSRVLLFSIVIGLSQIGSAYSQSMDSEVSALAGKMSKTLEAKGKSKVAVIDFTDLQGRPTELGRYLAEQLSVELVNAPRMSVVDRANIKSILLEHKLTEEGLVNPEAAKQLGKFAGVDAIIIGTVTALDEKLSLTVKAISTETAEIAAANKATFSLTKELHQLSKHGVSQNSASSPRLQTEAIASNEFDDVKLTLKSIKRVQVEGWYAHTRSLEGFQCVFEITNRSIQEPVVIACYSEMGPGVSGGTIIRSQITNSSGEVWSAFETRGVSVVREDRGGWQAPMVVFTDDSRPGPNHNRPREEKKWLGDFTTIPKGESVQAILTLRPRDGSETGATSNLLEFTGEFISGLGTILADGRIVPLTSSLRVHAVVWENIKISDSASH